MKSLVARVTRRRVPAPEPGRGRQPGTERRDFSPGVGVTWEYRISGPAWGGQVPIERVEVQIDGGPWQPARIDDRRGQYAWRLWSLSVRDLAPGKHSVVSRAIDATGAVQPTAEERRTRLASGREDNAQWAREFLVA